MTDEQVQAIIDFHKTPTTHDCYRPVVREDGSHYMEHFEKKMPGAVGNYRSPEEFRKYFHIDGDGYESWITYRFMRLVGGEPDQCLLVDSNGG